MRSRRAQRPRGCGEALKTKITKAVFIAATFFAFSAQAESIGFVTPSKMTMTVTSVGLIDTNNALHWASTTSTQVSWSAADKDFSPVTIDDVIVPEGRFVGAQVGYTTDRSVELSGHRYQGLDGAQGHDGQFVCSTPTGWAFQDKAADCPAPAAIAFSEAGGATATYFDSVYCVATPASKAGLCEATDTFIDASVEGNLTFNLLMDLYDNLQMDSDELSFDATRAFAGLNLANYPYVVFGGLGAAVHLSTHSASAGNQNDGELTLLFDPHKKLIFGTAFVTNGGGNANLAGICSGPGGVRATAAPAGGYLNPWGITNIGAFDVSNGLVALPLNGTIAGSSGGMNLIGDIRQPAGTAIGMNCVSDDSADISAWDANFQPALGYTYPTFPGNASSPLLNVTIAKIADPAGLFGIAGCDASTSTACGSYP